MSKFLVTYHGPGMTQPAAIDGYSIIEAESEAQALKLLQTHPFVARGGTLQSNL